ncbi:hypothetical protein FRC18_001281 [Serendipita sp. 400]|nr:hypothetical protein FRC18_001281 [Serendipita sp. 400]
MSILNASGSLDLIKDTNDLPLVESKSTRKKVSRAANNAAQQPRDHRGQGEGFSFIRQLFTDRRVITRITQSTTNTEILCAHQMDSRAGQEGWVVSLGQTAYIKTFPLNLVFSIPRRHPLPPPLDSNSGRFAGLLRRRAQWWSLRKMVDHLSGRCYHQSVITQISSDIIAHAAPITHTRSLQTGAELKEEITICSFDFIDCARVPNGP